MDELAFVSVQYCVEIRPGHCSLTVAQDVIKYALGQLNKSQR